MRGAIRWLLVLLLMGMTSHLATAEETPLLAKGPTLSRTEIVFEYGGYLWSVPREGGSARQLTTGGHESGPTFSPDGKWVAFSASYDGNRDVFVVPAAGGEPKRLTWHPGQDGATGWTPDGKRVLFVSDRDAYADITRLYTVPVEGGIEAGKRHRSTSCD
jgi:tricorn protease